MEVVVAEMSHLGSYTEFLSECFESGILKYESALQDSKEYLERAILHSEGKELPEGMPRTSTYLCLEGNEILGAIRYRHETTEYIERVIGHVGYETKPTARGKGVAKFMLSWVQGNVLIDNCIVTCEVGNVASKIVIERCGAKYLNQIFSPEKGNEVMRFQLQST